MQDLENLPFCNLHSLHNEHTELGVSLALLSVSMDPEDDLGADQQTRQAGGHIPWTSIQIRSFTKITTKQMILLFLSWIGYQNYAKHSLI